MNPKMCLLSRVTCCGLLVIGLFLCVAAAAEIEKVERWGVFEIPLEGPSAGNPYLDVDLKAVFRHEQTSVSVPGFYDGGNHYIIRFSPDRTGEWTYETQSDAAELNGRKGALLCIPPLEGNHGAVEIVNTFYLQYQDGSPFYSVGTTAYQWTSVKPSIQEETLKTLQRAPFNKIRMCVFPKWYQYGNETEPWAYPFEDRTNFQKPHYAFFQNFDLRVRQLRDMGIQADVILFHPYDHWGYAAMGKENNERYVRYLIARLSAYRNVWWSLANEWDVPKIKDAIDWDGIGRILQTEDPYNRLRGIHNWYDTEDHFYDHSRDWITHVSAQTSSFQLAIPWRNRYRKPVLFDEMRYEGDVASRWGNMTGPQMASYFWMAGLSGVYGTHGDTFRNRSDSETEVRWWAKGGQLPGSSPSRIAFFRKLMERLPIREMTPDLIAHGDPANRETNVYFLAKEGDIYLAYTANSDTEIRCTLPGDKPYQLDIIDTWNMSIEPKGQVQPGAFTFKTTNPYTAVCLHGEAYALQ